MRTTVVTGSASGIGATLAQLLTSRGGRVIGVDVHDADVVADLSTAEGRASLVQSVTELSGGHIDAIVANAGLAHPIPATIAVNYFGAVATLEGLRPLLAGSAAPRAAVTCSMASLMPNDPELVELCLAGDEAGALARAAVLAADEAEAGKIYASSKAGIARWLRRNAATPAWAGAGIPINAIAPGVVVTPMTAAMVDTEEKREGMRQVVPMPLNDFMGPEVPAALLAWLVSEENSHLCGQVIFVDGGSDVVIRGESTW